MDDRPAQPGQLTGEKGVNDYHNGDNLGLEPTTPPHEPPAAPQAEPSDDEWLRRLGELLGEYAEAVSFDSENDIERAANAIHSHARALLARYGTQPTASFTQVGTWEPDDPRWFIWNPGIVRDSFPAGTPIYVGQPTASADRVALADELAGVVADVEQGKGFDRVCLDTIKRVRNELLKQPAASAEPVAQVSRKGFHRGSIVWTAAGLVADLPDGTNLYAAPVAAQAQPKRRPYNASGSLSEYGISPECDAAPAASAEPSDEKTPSNSAITADEQREFLYLLKEAVIAARELRSAMNKISSELARNGKPRFIEVETKPVNITLGKGGRQLLDVRKALHKAGAPLCDKNGRALSLAERIEWIAKRTVRPTTGIDV